jgi:hypothetical protein
MLGSLSIMPKQSACAHLVGSPKPARNHIARSDRLTTCIPLAKDATRNAYGSPINSPVAKRCIRNLSTETRCFIEHTR